MKITVNKSIFDWVDGKFGDYTFEAKLYRNRVTGNLNDGRINRLFVRNKHHQCIFQYNIYEHNQVDHIYCSPIEEVEEAVDTLVNYLEVWARLNL